MGRKSSATARIFAVLNPYLERKDLEFSENGGKRQTLPTTTEEGKVNVTQLVRELQNEPGGATIKSHDTQHFYNDEIGSIVNAFAVTQGIKPIGIRSLANKDDDIVLKEMARQKSSMKEEHEAYLEAISDNVRLRKENAQLKAKLALVQENGILIRHPSSDLGQK